LWQLSWLRAREQVRIASPLAAQDAIGRLSAAFAEPWKPDRDSRRRWPALQIKGRVSGGRVRVAATDTLGQSAPFGPMFAGSVADLPQGGSELAGTIRPARGPLKIQVCVSAIGAPFFVYGVCDALSNAVYLHWVGVLQGLGFTVAGLLWICFFLVTTVRGIRAAWAYGEPMKEWLSRQLNP
jgi:hypothetical protein